MGYYYCPQGMDELSPGWSKSHPQGGFGDYKLELTSHGKPVKFCVLGKKQCYVDLETDAAMYKGTFKGVGQSSKPAKAYKERLDWLEANHEDPSKDVELKRLQDEALASPSVLTPELYETLASGVAVDACELRFQGSLMQLSELGYGMQSSLVTKLLTPPHWKTIQLRTVQSDEDGSNPHGNTIYEQAYPSGEPKGEFAPDKLLAWFDDKPITKDEMSYIVEQAQLAPKRTRGITMKFRGTNAFLSGPSIRFIQKTLQYFKGPYSLN